MIGPHEQTAPTFVAQETQWGGLVWSQLAVYCLQLFKWETSFRPRVLRNTRVKCASTLSKLFLVSQSLSTPDKGVPWFFMGFDTESIYTWPGNHGLSCSLRNSKASKSGLLSHRKDISTQRSSTNAWVLWKVTGFGCGAKSEQGWGQMWNDLLVSASLA